MAHWQFSLCDGGKRFADGSDCLPTGSEGAGSWKAGPCWELTLDTRNCAGCSCWRGLTSLYRPPPHPKMARPDLIIDLHNFPRERGSHMLLFLGSRPRRSRNAPAHIWISWHVSFGDCPILSLRSVRRTAASQSCASTDMTKALWRKPLYWMAECSIRCFAEGICCL